MIPLPTKSDVCRAAASFFAIKKLLNLCAAHTVEISWNSNLPCHKSKQLRVRLGSSSGTTFAIGFPAFAITNGSPLAACSTKRDRWVFAS